MHNAEHFFKAVSAKVGKYPENVIAFESAGSGREMVMIALFHDYVVKGRTLLVTFGLQEATFKSEDNQVNELVMLTGQESADEMAQSIGLLIDWKRDQELFDTGSMFRFGKALTSQTEMSAFLIGLPFPNFPQIQAQNRKVGVLELHPIYSEEVELLLKTGIKQFLSSGFYEPLSLQRRNLATLFNLN